MKIVICASVDFTYKIKEIKDKLEKLGHKTHISYMSQRILAGEISMNDYLTQKEKAGDTVFRESASEDLIKRYYNKIKESDAILIVNVDKKGIKNYIGGNSFLEIGFAYVMDKKIFLLNLIPDMLYKDEIIAAKPIVINGDLNKIK